MPSRPHSLDECNSSGKASDGVGNEEVRPRVPYDEQGREVSAGRGERGGGGGPRRGSRSGSRRWCSNLASPPVDVLTAHQSMMPSQASMSPTAAKTAGRSDLPDPPDEAILRGLEQLRAVQQLQQSISSPVAAAAAAAAGPPDFGAAATTTLASHRSALLPLKKRVSKKKRRFESFGISLDLTYITDRIIAMGFPSQGVEAIYRNDMKDVVRFLDTRHCDRYKVYNLCSERQYDPSNFHGRVMRFPFDDHNCPAFDRMKTFLEDVDEWLGQHPKNVVVIHCKAGKGRTGVTIATYLLYCGMWETAAQALSYYGFVRTQNSKGVTIPSQRRWVYYYEEVMALQREGLSLPPPEPLMITKIYISEGAPQFNSVSLACEALGVTYDTSTWKHKWRAASGGGGEFLSFSQATVTLVKDVRVIFRMKKMLSKKSVFSFWFNTQFVKHGYLRLRKDELDKVNKKKKQADFYIEVFFNTYDAAKVEIDLKINEKEEERRNNIVENMKAQFGFEGSDMSSETDEDAPANTLSVAQSVDTFIHTELDDLKTPSTPVSKSYGP